MNEFFDRLAARWTDVASRQDAAIEPPTLDAAVAEELLQLTRVVARAKERSFAPLAAYTAGVAVERLRSAKGRMDPAAAVAYLREVREELERESSGG